MVKYCQRYITKLLAALPVSTLLLLLSSFVTAQDFAHLKDRVEADTEAGAPLVTHATVVLCTNRQKNTDLCNENKARTNLYWGAQYGVKTYFNRQKSWRRISAPAPSEPGIMERVMYKRVLDLGNKELNLYLVADVWRGGDVKKAITHFLTMSSGEKVEKVKVEDETIYIGGEAHLTAYLGHNGLANFSLDLDLEKNTMPNSAVVLGRRTAGTFTQPLQQVGTFPLLTTKGVITPEAYILEAALTSWFSTVSPEATRQATAEVHSKFQKASIAWSKKLFVPGVAN